ncbi:hypothetical protein N8T08_007238 [Aspergillus melleus]|uniref:Uncharacterized protein n=1 Tax=Aspergillus melleus TaxID=138277 RepID=A0ACC3AY53_9EURO|nr:hypothetical protein N8T08_007238 [Aspergillus melleus]
MSVPALQGRDPKYFDPTIDRNRTQPKIALKRRASQSFFDIRTPQTTHPLLRPRPAYHGAHFEKAPLQDETLGTLERTRGTISRSHSISFPIRRREITEPYERRPESFTRRMRKEWEYYKALSDTPDRANERLVKQAEAVDFENDGILLPQGEIILAGVGAATVL